ncbi:MAG: hypothetical protein EU551_04325 [Promethearchaeota archaeon]|nr:MAG: hypothetical protein EU551_04325 [Candidatus Lokiarchaeota archaeon]
MTPDSNILNYQNVVLQNITKDVHKAIFGGQKKVRIGGQTYNVQTISRTSQRYVSIGQYRFVENDPASPLARQGHQILWVFKGDKSYARLVNRKFEIMDSSGSWRSLL